VHFNNHVVALRSAPRLAKIVYLDRSSAALQHAEADPAFLIEGHDLDPDQNPSGLHRIRQEAGMQGEKPAFETDTQLRGGSFSLSQSAKGSAWFASIGSSNCAK